jgi:acetylornithine deacetylase/succinyl-diaminopimelate desuccinylase-like protein
MLLTSDEEGAGIDGTAAVVRELQTRGERIDACILGEPTSVERLGDTIKNGRRGSLNGIVTVKGVQCHMAYPERGRSPILPSLPALSELAAIEWDRGNQYFSSTSFQISVRMFPLLLIPMRVKFVPFHVTETAVSDAQNDSPTSSRRFVPVTVWENVQGLLEAVTP